MDGPLFDAERKNAQILEYGSAAVVVIFVAFSVIACFVIGIQRKAYEHFVFAILLVLTIGILAILVMWWRQGDLDPKFKWLMLFTAFVVIFSGVAANVYIWQPLPPAEICFGKWGNSSYYNYGQNKCVQLVEMDNCWLQKRGFCVQMDSDTRGVCRNCTPTGPPRPTPIAMN